MKAEKTVEELRQETSRMRTLGMTGAVLSIAGAALAGAVSVPAAAVIGLGGLSVAAASLLRKLADERALARRLGTNQAEAVLTP